MKNVSWFANMLIIILLMTVAYNYNGMMVKKDYLILIPIACDPQAEDCFEDQCLQESPDECINAVPYYKLMTKRAYNIPACYSLPPAERKNCPALQCAPKEKDCFVDYCDEEDEKAGMVCK